MPRPQVSYWSDWLVWVPLGVAGFVAVTVGWGLLKAAIDHDPMDPAGAAILGVMGLFGLFVGLLRVRTIRRVNAEGVEVEGVVTACRGNRSYPTVWVRYTIAPRCERLSAKNWLSKLLMTFCASSA